MLKLYTDGKMYLDITEIEFIINGTLQDYLSRFINVRSVEEVKERLSRTLSPLHDRPGYNDNNSRIVKYWSYGSPSSPNESPEKYESKRQASEI